MNGRDICVVSSLDILPGSRRIEEEDPVAHTSQVNGVVVL